MLHTYIYENNDSILKFLVPNYPYPPNPHFSLRVPHRHFTQPQKTQCPSRK